MSASTSEVMGSDNDNTIKYFERTFITTPDKAAKTILNGVKKNKRRVLIGPDAYVFDAMVRLFPAGCQWIITKVVKLQGKLNKKSA